MVAPNVIVVADSEVVLANPLNSFEIAYVGLFYLIHFVYFLVLLLALPPFLLVIGNEHEKFGKNTSVMRNHVFLLFLLLWFLAQLLTLLVQLLL